ncbi:uncharacterized protein LOC114292711 [Camellia sinensis]|uniref:uncharacterized protein LOC114292711 n=1 Tax=Camellia sinensis TaxID=4442 RepID=UPI001035EE11|nr:uncharacterized protein LOC114292711 [Camellia sinensis]
MGFPPNIILWIKACMTSPTYSICINGSLHGYFRGERGLRQGDPMSPYLFVIVMEILSRILAEKASHPDFKFHWRCEKTKIVNLCFADDLMIFCKGDVSTVQSIKLGLEEFKSLSGLSPSPNKSHIFFSGCDVQLRNEILGVCKFSEGKLPVRYLGVPLVSTKLKAIDCDQLVERITKRVKSWTNKCLNYAGRAQLIQSVLFSMQVYWTSLFILPKKVIRSIESLFRAFFWSGCELKKHGAKVSWDRICCPKKEGGLGFKSLTVWNKAAIAKHVWFLFSGGEQSMWCIWVKSYILKGRSFWRVRVPNDPSWVWRKILSLRPIIYPLLKHRVGNGSTVFLWFDNWHPMGSLWDKFGGRIVYDSALGIDAKVSEIVEGNSWRWPFPSSWELRELIDNTPPTFLPTGGSDDVSWCPASNSQFTIQSTWHYLRKHFDPVNWSTLLWGPYNIPKVSFVVWMAILGRLNTGDRLQNFGVTLSVNCVFCQHLCEDHNHLFFECPFSERVWSYIKGHINVSWPSIPWDDLVQLIAQSVKGKSLGAIITKLAFTCTVYQLWIARNNRVFNKEMVPEEVVIKGIVDMVRFRVMHITNLKSHQTDSWFLQSWRLPHTMVKPSVPGWLVQGALFSEWCEFINCGLSVVSIYMCGVLSNLSLILVYSPVDELLILLSICWLTGSTTMSRYGSGYMEILLCLENVCHLHETLDCFAVVLMLMEMLSDALVYAAAYPIGAATCWIIAKSVKGKSLGAIITKLAFTCTVYQLWVARNNRVFSKDMVPEEVVIKCIVDMVRFRVMHITNLKTNHNDSWYLSSWKLPRTMLKHAAADVRIESSLNVG